MAIEKERGSFVQTDVTVQNTGNANVNYAIRLRYIPTGGVNPAYELTQGIGVLTPGQSKTQSFSKLVTDQFADGDHDTIVDLFDADTSKVLDSETSPRSFTVKPKPVAAGSIVSVITY